MFTVDLECENGHKFEGWYDNRAEYEGIRDANELTCPLCESPKVRNTLRTGDPVTSKRAVKQENERVSWVGDSFADEAIDMWEGRKPSKSILGFAGEEDRKRLDEAGVPTTDVVVGILDDEPPDPSEIN